MTASIPPSGSAPLDSTAQLMTQITAQLTSGLAHAGARSLRRPGVQAGVRAGAQAGAGPGPRVGGARTARPLGLPTLVAVAHGSRDPQALRTVTALLDQVRALRPDLRVRLGHIELNEPLLSDTLATLRGEAVLVPLLLGRGYHIKHDLPQALADAPGVTGRVAAPLGPHPLLAAALHDRLIEAGWRDTPAAARRGGVVLAAAGSRDPDSAADAVRTAQLLSVRLGGVPVVPAYASAATPTVAEAIDALAARGRTRIAVASYFTAPGRFATQCAAAAAPHPAAAPLGPHPALARLVLRRYDRALRTPAGSAADSTADSTTGAAAGDRHLARA